MLALSKTLANMMACPGACGGAEQFLSTDIRGTGALVLQELPEQFSF